MHRNSSPLRHEKLALSGVGLSQENCTNAESLRQREMEKVLSAEKHIGYLAIANIGNTLLGCEREEIEQFYYENFEAINMESEVITSNIVRLTYFIGTELLGKSSHSVREEQEKFLPSNG